MTNLIRFLKDKSGATAIEYGLIAAGIAIAIVTAVNLVGTRLNNLFNKSPQDFRPRDRGAPPGKSLAAVVAAIQEKPLALRAGGFSYRGACAAAATRERNV